MGQINLVQEAIPFIKENGSFTLVPPFKPPFRPIRLAASLNRLFAIFSPVTSINCCQNALASCLAQRGI